jgi:hypothetical protein
MDKRYLLHKVKTCWSGATVLWHDTLRELRLNFCSLFSDRHSSKARSCRWIIRKRPAHQSSILVASNRQFVPLNFTNIVGTIFGNRKRSNFAVVCFAHIAKASRALK